MSVELRDCSPFNHIQVHSIDVELLQGSGFSLQVHGDSNLLEYIETIFNGNELVVKVKDGTSFLTNKKPKVVAQIPEDHVLKAISVNGSGNFISESLLGVDDLSLQVHGSGDFKGSFKGQRITANVTGSGDLKIKGSCQQLVCNVLGSGDINALELESDSVQVAVHGSGSAQVAVKSNLTANVYGSGSVKYKGNPPKKDCNVHGSGEIKKY